MTDSANLASPAASASAQSSPPANAKFENTVRQEEAYLRRVHPTPADIPSCMSFLDDFLSCHIMGPQIKSLYRYGQTSACGSKLDEFKFCMSIKSLHPEEKRDVWIRRRAEWWARRRLGKSSEDVWEMRSEPLQNTSSVLRNDSNSITIG